MTRLAPSTALGLLAASLLFAAPALAQQPGAPAAATPKSTPAASPPADAAPPSHDGGRPPGPIDPAGTPAVTSEHHEGREGHDDTVDNAPLRKPNGWDTHVAVGAAGTFANNTNVAGQTVGSSFALGLMASAGADLNYHAHEWRNSLILGAFVTRTPAIAEFVKTADYLNLESMYLLHVNDWFGPFVRLQLLTTMFPGRDVRAGKASYEVAERDGSKRVLQVAGIECDPVNGVVPTTCRTSLSLADAFRPMTWKQSIGLFAQPLQHEYGTIELRGGVGAQEVIANNQLAVVDEAATAGVIELARLQNTNQFGGEVSVAAWGSAVDKRLVYKLTADLMTPFAHSRLKGGDDRSAFQLTNIYMDATVSFKLIEWISLDYQLRVLRQPQVVDLFQVQNALLLTFGLSYGSSPAAAPEGLPPTPAEPAPAAPPPAPAAPAAPAAPPAAN